LAGQRLKTHQKKQNLPLNYKANIFSVDMEQKHLIEADNYHSLFFVISLFVPEKLVKYYIIGLAFAIDCCKQFLDAR